MSSMSLWGACDMKSFAFCGLVLILISAMFVTTVFAVAGCSKTQVADGNFVSSDDYSDNSDFSSQDDTDTSSSSESSYSNENNDDYDWVVIEYSEGEIVSFDGITVEIPQGWEGTLESSFAVSTLEMAGFTDFDVSEYTLSLTTEMPVYGTVTLVISPDLMDAYRLLPSGYSSLNDILNSYSKSNQHKIEEIVIDGQVGYAIWNTSIYNDHNIYLSWGDDRLMLIGVSPSISGYDSDVDISNIALEPEFQAAIQSIHLY